MPSSPRPVLLSLLACCVLLAALSPSAAYAQDREAAERFFFEGQQAYAGGEYGTAIFKFEQAYEADPNGIFLYMSSVSYLKSDNLEKALEFGRRAREKADDLDEDMRARNDARIHAIESGIQSRQSAQTTSALIGESRRLNAASAPVEGGGGRSGIGGVGWTGVTLTAVGAGLMLSSLYFERQVRDLTITDSDGMPKIPADREEEFNRARTTGLITLGSGAIVTLVGGGLLLYGLGSREPSGSATLQVAPARDGGYAGVHVEF